MEHALIEQGEVGRGILAYQVRAVVEAHRGVAVVASRLGVTTTEANLFAARAGVRILKGIGGPPPKITAGQVALAILSEASLCEAARALGVSPAALHHRARRMGLPTDPAGRAAYRQGAAA